MNRSRSWFDAAARETGFRANTLEKVTRLGELAGEVARHPLLGAALALKGGTALNLCFGPPRRLSVDLDFNFVGSENRAGMLEDRPMVERSIESLALSQGYRLQWSRAEHAGRKAYLRYLLSAGVADRVELDLNDGGEVAVVCTHGESRQNVSILDLPLPDSPPEGWEWIEAYWYWARGLR